MLWARPPQASLARIWREYGVNMTLIWREYDVNLGIVEAKWERHLGFTEAGLGRGKLGLKLA